MFDPFSPLPARPSHWPYRNAVGIVAVNEQGLVLMGEARGFQDIWKMPQGGVEAGETHQQAAKRELREETGLRRVTFERQAQLRSACEYPDGSNYMRGFRGQSFEWFLARVQDAKLDPAKFTPGLEDQEFGKLRWVTPQQALVLAHNNYGGDHVTYQRQKIYHDVFVEFGLLSATPTPERGPQEKPAQDGKLIIK